MIDSTTAEHLNSYERDTRYVNQAEPANERALDRQVCRIAVPNDRSQVCQPLVTARDRTLAALRVGC